MAFSPSYKLSSAILPRKKYRLFHQPFQVRAHCNRDHQGENKMDQGRSGNNIVDANLRVLSERIEEVKNKEKLERCCEAKGGWNYAPFYDTKRQREKEMAQFLQLVGTIFGIFGFTIVNCSFCLWIVSLLVHLNYQ